MKATRGTSVISKTLRGKNYVTVGKAADEHFDFQPVTQNIVWKMCHPKAAV
jgi:hypothetical protein